MEEGENGGDSILEGLGDDNEGILLEVKKKVVIPVWKKNTGGYLQGIKECSSSATEKREQRRKKKLKKLAFTTKSILFWDIIKVILKKWIYIEKKWYMELRSEKS